MVIDDEDTGADGADADEVASKDTHTGKLSSTKSAVDGEATMKEVTAVREVKEIGGKRSRTWKEAFLETAGVSNLDELALQMNMDPNYSYIFELSLAILNQDSFSWVPFPNILFRSSIRSYWMIWRLALMLQMFRLTRVVK